MCFLSIRHIYNEATHVTHSSMLPLYYGKCLLHNLGNLNYVCSSCGDLCWKVEGKSIRTFVGKNCCSSGKLKLLPLCEPPAELKLLMQAGDARSKRFIANIRGVNNALGFASLGAHVDESILQGRGVYTFKVHGSVYHNIGPMMLGEVADQIPRFAQLYFYDTEHELENRLHHNSNLDVKILDPLQAMMHRVNPYAQAFCSARMTMQDTHVFELRMVITDSRANGWQYLAPCAFEVATIMP